MANREHLKLVQGSFQEIRAWHERNPDEWLDLSGTDMSLGDLSDAPLGKVDLSLADLSHANLSRAKLSEAEFTRANLTDARLVGTDLSMSNLTRADLRGADLRGANLTLAVLDRSNLGKADLQNANLEGADLFETNLSEAKLTGANFTEARCGGTIFAKTDLSGVKGLDTVKHLSPSTVGLDVLVQSKGKIPQKFLRSCGVPDDLVDMVRGRYRPGESVGSWVLLRRLGRGGNGEVWEARSEKGVAAVKMLRSRKPKSAAYSRFRAEVHILRQLGKRPAVLPLIDASLPAEPSRDNPAWLAMPVAANIRKGLVGERRRLERVVEGLVAISDTLAALHAERIYHRDIKPENLFWYQDSWAIGDFGLVDFPDKRAITKQGRKLGPQHFLAPEMVTKPDKADGAAADVYSLAKTLWVLATGQNYPPPGEQRRDIPGIGIGNYVQHPRAVLLDRIIEEATRHNSEGRPTMAQLSSELRKWLAAPNKRPS